MGHEDKINFWLKGEDSKKVCKCIETLGKVTKGFRVHIANYRRLSCMQLNWIELTWKGLRAKKSMDKKDIL